MRQKFHNDLTIHDILQANNILKHLQSIFGDICSDTPLVVHDTDFQLMLSFVNVDESEAKSDGSAERHHLQQDGSERVKRKHDDQREES